MALVIIEFDAGIPGTDFAEKIAERLPGVELQMLSQLSLFELGWRPHRRRVSMLIETLLRWGEGWAGQSYSGFGPGAPLLSGHHCLDQNPPEHVRRTFEHIAQLPSFWVVACPGAASMWRPNIGTVTVYLHASLSQRVRLLMVNLTTAAATIAKPELGTKLDRSMALRTVRKRTIPLMDAEVSQLAGAGLHERSESRLTYRNGY